MAIHELKIAYVTIGAVEDVSQWSGLAYHIHKNLVEAGATLTPIDKLHTSFSLVAKVYSRLLRNRYHFSREHSIVASYSKQVEKRLACVDADVVLSPGTLPVAYLNCRQPLCIWTDATFGSLEGFYPGYHNLCRRTLTHAHQNERSALNRCSLAMFSSEWAARSAVEDYGTSTDVVKVVPFGANLSNVPSMAELYLLRGQSPAAPFHLLFAGVEWERKGGGLAVETVAALNEQGLHTVLDVLGCEPPKEVASLPFVSCHGFLSKSRPEEEAKIAALFARSHLFILPTRADCLPVVLVEAAAYGLPALVCNVGGIPSVIEDGANGRLLPLQASAADYAAAAARILTAPELHRSMSLLARDVYDKKFNWAECARTALELLKKYVKKSHHQRSRAEGHTSV